MIKIFLFLIFIIVLIFSCNRNISTISDSQEELLHSIDSELSVADILKLQKIESLHFNEYVSTKTDGELSNTSSEVFIETFRFRKNYLSNNEIIAIYVFDLIKWDFWFYKFHDQSYVEFGYRDTLKTFELNLKPHITSKIHNPVKSVKMEYFEGKKCHVVTDSLGNVEWIWVKHGLPVKWKKSYIIKPAGIHIEINGELRGIEVNTILNDSLYIRPF